MISSHAFRSLRHRNFRLFYIGQLISLNGTWMQNVAQAWLIYRLTDSGFMLGLVGTLTMLPNLLLGIFGGWLADRFPRHRLMMILQCYALVQALILAVLTLGGWIQPWHILLLAFMLGLMQAADTPVRQAFLSQLVEREDIPNAIALSSSMFHLARFIGPAIAGVLVAVVGEGPVFLINALTFVAVLISLMLIRLPAVDKSKLQQVPSNIWSGFVYAWQHKLTRTLLGLIAVVSLFSGAAVILLPIFVSRVFDHGPESLGVFMGMMGAGSLAAALMLANQRDFQLLERRVAVAAVLVALSLLAFAVNQFYSLALVLLLIMGFCTTTVFASSNALIQLAVPDYLRGRIMALFAISLHGMVSIGQIILGSAADFLGAPLTVGISAAILIGLTLVLALALYRLDAAQHTGHTS